MIAAAATHMPTSVGESATVRKIDCAIGAEDEHGLQANPQPTAVSNSGFDVRPIPNSETDIDRARGMVLGVLELAAAVVTDGASLTTVTVMPRVPGAGADRKLR